MYKLLLVNLTIFTKKQIKNLKKIIISNFKLFYKYKSEKSQFI